mgnify:CR=1 FL=1
MEEQTIDTQESEATEGDFKVGYMIGLDKEDKFVFETFGTEQGITQLLGLHQIAGSRLNEPFEQEKFRKLYDVLQKTLHIVTSALAATSTVPTPPPIPLPPKE